MNAYLQSLHPTDTDWSDFLDRVTREFDCCTGTLHRLDAADRHLKLVAHCGIPPQLIPVIQSIPVGKGIAGAAAERQQPVELCNLQADTSGVAKPGARQTHVQGSLAVPMMDGSRLCGTLGIGKMTPYEFSPDEKERLLSIARQAAARLLPTG
jgi:putative methionine-R-sulfoxide reductase with GAF domain